MSPLPVALYVHFPFCLSICPYCDFVVYAGSAARGPRSRIDAFVHAVVREIRLRAQSGRALASVYLGGGTPSLMSVAQVARVLDAADHGFGISAGAEVTIEANPGPGERGDLAGFRAAGVNRLSIGAQSFDSAELRRLGRRHSAADIAAAVGEARRAGFDNVSLDLLYDIPGQTVDSWWTTLDSALGLQPDHVSAYALALDASEPTADHLPISPGAARWRARASAAQDADLAADLYEMAEAAFRVAGFQWYEVSNWAGPGRTSRHNMAYWSSEPWEAVGPGAHAFDGARTRRWNDARLDAYLGALLPTDGSAARLPPGGSDTTDEQTAAAEKAFLRLRTRAGLPADMATHYAPAISWARTNALVERTADGGVRLTMRGRLLSNEIFARMLPDVAEVAA